MSKFNLNYQPKSFNGKVDIPMLDGTTAEIEMHFIYRSRSDYAKLLDDTVNQEINNIKKEAKEAGAKKVSEVAATETVDDEAEAKSKIEAMFAAEDDAAVEFMMKIASGWDLKDKFDKKALLDMNNKFPGAFGAINAAYRLACQSGRVKN